MSKFRSSVTMQMSQRNCAAGAKELWSRFAIPLVQLGSQGSQKVRQSLAASRDPYTSHLRVIIAFDAVKSLKYRAQLEKLRWDAVVIDEVHNSTNADKRNNAFALRVTSIAEAFILPWLQPTTMIRNQQGLRNKHDCSRHQCRD